MVVSVFRVIAEQPKELLYSHQKKYIQSSNQDSTEPGYVNIRELAEGMCRYDLDDVDLYWLNTLNRELERMGKGPPWGCNSSKSTVCFLLDSKVTNETSGLKAGRKHLMFGTNQQSDQGCFNPGQQF